MKKRITKIWGVVLIVALLSALLFICGPPASADDGQQVATLIDETGAITSVTIGTFAPQAMNDAFYAVTDVTTLNQYAVGTIVDVAKTAAPSTAVVTGITDAPTLVTAQVATGSTNNLLSNIAAAVAQKETTANIGIVNAASPSPPWGTIVLSIAGAVILAIAATAIILRKRHSYRQHDLSLQQTRGPDATVDKLLTSCQHIVNRLYTVVRLSVVAGRQTSLGVT